MRIATFVPGLFVCGIMFLQSCAAYSLASAGDALQGVESSNATVGPAGGILISLMALVAVAFVPGLPLVSFIVYLLAALQAFTSAGDFPNLIYYGWALLALSVMSFVGWWSRRRTKHLRRWLINFH